MKIALDYVFVGGSQPEVLLVRVQVAKQMYYAFYDQMSQTLYDQYQYLIATQKVKPWWVAVEKVADMPGYVSNLLQPTGYQQISKDDLLGWLEVYDVELYTTTDMTQIVLQTLGFKNKMLIRYITPYDYHNNLDVFSCKPVTFSNSANNEIIQGINSVKAQIQKIVDKHGTRIYGHPMYEELIKYVSWSANIK